MVVLGNENFVNTKAAFLQNARPERTSSRHDIHPFPQSVIPKQGMSQYLVVGSGVGWLTELAVLLH
jgi:hypothetical protein